MTPDCMHHLARQRPDAEGGMSGLDLKAFERGLPFHHLLISLQAKASFNCDFLWCLLHRLVTICLFAKAATSLGASAVGRKFYIGSSSSTLRCYKLYQSFLYGKSHYIRISCRSSSSKAML